LIFARSSDVEQPTKSKNAAMRRPAVMNLQLDDEPTSAMGRRQSLAALRFSCPTAIHLCQHRPVPIHPGRLFHIFNRSTRQRPYPPLVARLLPSTLRFPSAGVAATVTKFVKLATPNFKGSRANFAFKSGNIGGRAPFYR
jgi:hypothetical protein